jgi:glucan phosphoethanolaminetransferase (alkaline phosphatase superfamily)
MLELVIEEIEERDPDAIVVFQSDHGPSINLKW